MCWRHLANLVLLANVRWGLEIDASEPRIECIKLFLDKVPKFPDYVSPTDTQAQLDKHGRSVEDVIADYLTKLLKHAEAEMRDTYYSALLAGTKRQYVLTVPAVWSDRAKDLTMRAAKRAGATGEVAMISGKNLKLAGYGLSRILTITLGRTRSSG